MPNWHYVYFTGKTQRIFQQSKVTSYHHDSWSGQSCGERVWAPFTLLCLSFAYLILPCCLIYTQVSNTRVSKKAERKWLNSSCFHKPKSVSYSFWATRTRFITPTASPQTQTPLKGIFELPCGNFSLPRTSSIIRRWNLVCLLFGCLCNWWKL